MTELYTTAFVSKDFVEGDAVERAEVFVVVGKGNITEIKDSGSGKAKQVIIDAGREHQGRPLYSKGWAPADSDIIKKAQEALDNEETVEFRIETVRNPKNTRTKENVDRSIPIDELRKGMENARENVTLSVARIKLVSEDDWTDGILRTNIKEDRVKTGRTAADLDDSELDTGRKASSGSSYEYSDSVEPQAWISRLKNGSVNPGSYHVAALSNIYGFVADWNREHSDVEIDVEAARRISRSLLGVAGKLQVKIFDGELEAPDLGKQSHTRARALIFETIKNQEPITEGVVENSDEFKAWLRKVYNAALSHWQWSVETVEPLV